jgi:acetyl esterase
MTLRSASFAIAALLLCITDLARSQDSAENPCSRFAGTPQTLPSPEVVEGATASYVFKSVDQTRLRMHVFAPSAATTVPRAAVIFFFGGGWMTGDVSAFAPQARYVAARGATAILADYRTYCRNGVEVDAQVADAADAVRWVRSHARELGIDPQRIAVGGGSSGGHLALTTAVFNQPDAAGTDSTPDLLVLFYPCVDLTSDLEQDFSGKAIASHGIRLSPLFHIRRELPPTIIFQGTADPLYLEVRSYCQKARDAGNKCELIEYAGAGHGFFNPASPTAGKWYDAALDAMGAVLAREGWLPAQGQ